MLASIFELPFFLPEYGATIHPRVDGAIIPFMLDGSGNSAQFEVSSSLEPALCGTPLILQAAVIDPTAMGFVAFSDGLRILFGGKDLDGPPPGAPVPDPPVLDPHDTETSGTSVLLTGSAPGAATVELQGPGGPAGGAGGRRFVHGQRRAPRPTRPT